MKHYLVIQMMLSDVKAFVNFLYFFTEFIPYYSLLCGYKILLYKVRFLSFFVSKMD